MFFHGRSYHSTAVGGRLVDVRCDQCGCEYAYQLTRIGSGSGASVYGVGNSAASKSATKSSKADLSKRLANEAELVPCPKCHWINEDLIRGYRLGRWRALGTLALYVAVVGPCASLIVVWFVAQGPVNDRAAIPKILAIGPAVSIAIAVALLLFRNLFRARIRPNALFPSPPILPAGCPPALLKDSGVGQRQATPQPAIIGEGLSQSADEWIVFQVGRDALPTDCCQCLQPRPPSPGYKIPVILGLNLVVPFCDACARQRKRNNRIRGLVTSVLVLGVALGALFAIRPSHDAFWMLFVAAFLISPCVGGAVAHELAKPVCMKVVDSSRGVVRLWFRNPDYRQLIRPTSQSA